MMLHVLHTAEPSIHWSYQLFSSYIADNYINNTTLCSLATWGKYKGNTQSVNLLLPFKIKLLCILYIRFLVRTCL